MDEGPGQIWSMRSHKGAGIYFRLSANLPRFLAWYSPEREDKIAPPWIGDRQGSVCGMLGTSRVPEEGNS